MLELRIRPAQNGWIVRETDDDDLDGVESVFEIPDSEHGDLEAMQGLLYHIIETFGLIGSKHDKKRLRVDIEPGGDHGESIQIDGHSSPADPDEFVKKYKESLEDYVSPTSTGISDLLGPEPAGVIDWDKKEE